MNRSARIRTIAYWVTTVALAWELGFGGLSDLLRLHYVLEVVRRLGYPPYLLTILGSWKLLATVTLLVPRRPLLKEWAYAGSFFALTGAAASHLTCRSSQLAWVGPLIGACFTIASWALRPESRRMSPRPNPTAEALAWTACPSD